ncbi:MAG: MBL fold metallo-hydrolase [Mucilaginibacter sp.]|uniref:MBL fold metallo-hydrolase n=1 Tax=Mucilaginibacter sp. TaxID=1882438 RepID=UPI0032658432
MKITKYIHSCLTFEQDGFKLLVDPGNYTFAEGRVKPQDFADVQAIIITHIHPDHLDMDNLKKIIALSKAPIYTNKQVAEALRKQGIDSELFTDGKRMFGKMEFMAMPVTHMPLLDSPIPEMTGYIINGNILHPVDSFQTELTKIENIELLVLPVMAPFCNELQVTAFADAMRPKNILPVHDGYAKEFFVKARHANYVKHFAAIGTRFLQAPSATLADGTQVVFKFGF